MFDDWVAHFHAPAEMLPLRIRPAVPIDDDALFDLCARNEMLRIERTAEGELLIMTPAGGETGRRNVRFAQRLANWSDADGTGVTFDSSTGFLLPNGAERAPDAAWVRMDRWNGLTASQREKFPPLCPDFVAEIASPSDSQRQLEAKMREYIENGAQLGWLLLPKHKRVLVYRADGSVTRLDDPETVDGEAVLPGFVFRPREIWSNGLSREAGRPPRGRRRRR
jgi:Uma2 family endonuclease